MIKLQQRILEYEALGGEDLTDIIEFLYQKFHQNGGKVIGYLNDMKITIEKGSPQK